MQRKPCKYLVNELGRCVLQGLKCEHTANCVTCEAARERWGGVGRGEIRGKRCFVFKGNDSDGMQGTGHSSLHFSAASCKGSWHPQCTFIQQVFMEAGFVLVPVPGTLITQILPRAGRVLAANRIQIK